MVGWCVLGSLGIDTCSCHARSRQVFRMAPGCTVEVLGLSSGRMRTRRMGEDRGGVGGRGGGVGKLDVVGTKAGASCTLAGRPACNHVCWYGRLGQQLQQQLLLPQVLCIARACVRYWLLQLWTQALRRHGLSVLRPASW